MPDETMKDIGKVFLDKDGAMRIYISKKIAEHTNFKNKERIKVTFVPIEKKIIIEELQL